MKSLSHYIQEKLIIKKNKATNYKYFPQSKEELKAIIETRIENEGNKVDLNEQKSKEKVKVNIAPVQNNIKTNSTIELGIVQSHSMLSNETEILTLSKNSFENKNEIELSQELMNFITNMQDEVHRVAIEYNRNLRNKDTTKSKLDSINGIGEKRKQELLKKFGSVEGIKKIKKVREKLEYPLPIMLDTKGPEYRIRDFKNGKETLTDGQAFTFTTRDLSGDSTIVSVNYADLVSELKTGDRILVNNGLLIFEVKELTVTDVICEVISGGEISDRKSMNFPNHVFKGPYLSDDDKSDLLFGIENDVDFVAASFVSNKENVCELRKFLDENGGKDIDIIAKIENRAGVDNIDEICEIADGIMVARGCHQ